MKENGLIKAVLLDMDGTVLDTEPIHKAAWETAMDAFGLKKHWDLLYQCIGLSETDMKKLFFEKIGLENFDEVYDEAKKVSREIKKNGIAVKKGFFELDKFLKENGIKSAIVTSSVSQSAVRDLERAGILNRFDLVLGFGDYEGCKPSPEPYLTAVKKLGVTADNCIAAEDSENGVRAAVSAGIKCVFIKDIVDISAETLSTAYKSAENLSDLIGIINELNDNN